MKDRTKQLVLKRDELPGIPCLRCGGKMTKCYKYNPFKRLIEHEYHHCSCGIYWLVGTTFHEAEEVLIERELYPEYFEMMSWEANHER